MLLIVIVIIMNDMIFTDDYDNYDNYDELGPGVWDEQGGRIISHEGIIN